MKNKFIILAILVAILAIAFLLSKGGDRVGETNNTIESPAISDDNSLPEGEVDNLPVEPAAVEARKDLATRLKIDEKSIVIMKVEARTWNDGCLGLGGIAESCIQALVEGFRVELLAQGKTYIYRTDKTGASLRAES
jgi:hypothetical protein